jgi:hypothetical protein
MIKFSTLFAFIVCCSLLYGQISDSLFFTKKANEKLEFEIEVTVFGRDLPYPSCEIKLDYDFSRNNGSNKKLLEQYVINTQRFLEVKNLAQDSSITLLFRVSISPKFFSTTQANFIVAPSVVARTNSGYSVKPLPIPNKKIFIKCEEKEIWTLEDYQNNVPAEFRKTKIIYKDGFYEINGVDTRSAKPMKFKILLQPGESFYEEDVFNENSMTFSIISTPAKIRRPRKPNTILSEFSFKNFGLHFGLLNIDHTTYKFNGKITNHNFGIGVMTGLSGHRSTYNYLDPLNPIVEEYESIFFSFGFSLMYRINGFSIHYFPFAWDGHISSTKGYRSPYGNTYWTGFGIGFSPGYWNRK